MTTPAKPASKVRQALSRALFGMSLALLGWTLYARFVGGASWDNVLVASALVLMNVDAVVESKDVRNISMMVALGLIIMYFIRRAQGV